MVHIGKLIEQELRKQERSVTWFANKLYCERTNVYSIFKRESIDTALLLRISDILHHNFLIIILKNCKNVIFIQHKRDYNNINNLTFFYTM